MIPRYMGAAASIEALTELQPVPDDREDELLALAASEASEASLRYFWNLPKIPIFSIFFCL